MASMKVRKIIKTKKPSDSELQAYMKKNKVDRMQALAALIRAPGHEPSKADLQKIMQEYGENEAGAREIYYLENDMMDGNAQALTKEGDLVLYENSGVEDDDDE